jgi:4-hydroxy-3-methylbut-2-enyl diphosphate reductase IspH
MENIAVEFHAKDTICGQVSGRESQLQKFAEQNDVVIFVAGRASSNGKVLYDVCKNVNPRTYFIEDTEELVDEMVPRCFDSRHYRCYQHSSVAHESCTANYSDNIYGEG